MSFHFNFKKVLFAILSFLLIGFSIQAQPFTYWPYYNKTPISSITKLPWVETDHDANGIDVSAGNISKVDNGKTISYSGMETGYIQ